MSQTTFILVTEQWKNDGNGDTAVKVQRPSKDRNVKRSQGGLSTENLRRNCDVTIIEEEVTTVLPQNSQSCYITVKPRRSSFDEMSVQKEATANLLQGEMPRRRRLLSGNKTAPTEEDVMKLSDNIEKGNSDRRLNDEEEDACYCCFGPLLWQKNQSRKFKQKRAVSNDAS